VHDPQLNSPGHERGTSAGDAASRAEQVSSTVSRDPRRRATRKEVEQKLAVLQARQQEAQARLNEAAERLAELDEERAVTLGEAQLAERHTVDLAEHLERLQQELAAAEVAEAEDALRDAARVRDAVLAEAAEAADRLATAIDAIATARASVRETEKRLRALDRSARTVVPPETNVFDERWRALAPMVEAELGVRLESELVEAAVRSGNHLSVKSLPDHLQELARQRQRDLMRARTTATRRPS
jgi:DNA repair ATPase RecN